MKIVQIIPGVGDTFYCQNCMRDKEVLGELRARGHDVVLAPMYLPVFSEGEDIAAGAPVFYGAVGVYLSQYFAGAANAPAWVKHLLDSRRLLGWVARKGGTTRAAGLEGMTLSVLRGENGGQSAELGRLVDWLVKEGKPDVVHLSNALLIGLAGKIRRELGVPVICSLQDEDSWIDSMEHAAAMEAWNLIAEKSSDVCAFIPVSNYYSKLMQERLRMDSGKFHVVPVGISTGGYTVASGAAGEPVIGYLSKMSESLGLEVLVDAFMILKSKTGLGNLRLRVMGGHTPEDKSFLERLRRKLGSRGMLGSVDFLTSFDRDSRIAFLKSLSVMSVPMPQPEAFGMFILEALASGVPVVQPGIGAFPELVEATQGGICYEPNDVTTLAGALESLLRDRDLAARLGQAGRKAVCERFDVARTADSMMEVYRKCLAV
ncbi:MAG: glycosyltransferase family 4 protein [bacterium]